MNEVIKESLTTALTDYCRDGMFPDEAADAAILALREWLEERGLAIVPAEPTPRMFEANSNCTTQELWAGIGWAAMIAAAPDALRAEGE
jgi:hypothetical protein